MWLNEWFHFEFPRSATWLKKKKKKLFKSSKQFTMQSFPNYVVKHNLIYSRPNEMLNPWKEIRGPYAEARIPPT